ncbi:MAG: ferredoxin reductase family protein [Thalassovita sp.]
MRPWGIILSVVALLFPFIWFSEIAKGRDIIALFSQFMGIASLIGMAIVQLIATRLPVVEWLFGGLDRSYIVHKWLGIMSMVFLLLHDTVDAEMRGLGAQNFVEELAETLGELSLYGLLILVVITVATFIPYHLWRWTHRFMGGFFLAGALHYLFILKPFKNGDPLGLYVSAFCLLGALAFAWRLLPARMRPSRGYVVSSVEQTGGALAITMTPNGRPLRHRAGQFAFACFDGAEPHPFTISSAPQSDGSLRLSVARLGDYTARLHQMLQTGTPVRLEGPFGHFERAKTKGPQLWIAAGIGVTPFLAWAKELSADDAPVHMVYCVRSEADAPHLAELRDRAAAQKNLTLHVHISADKGRATAEGIMAQTGLSGDGLTVSFCGPKPMRQALIDGFAVHGVTGRRFRYEEFEIRTGVGLRKLAALLFERVSLPQGVQDRLTR